MRDMYQWKWHVKNLLEAKLFQLKGLDPEKRFSEIKKIKELSSKKIIIREKQAAKGITLSLNTGYFRISTVQYEDNIKMKKMDVDFEERILDIERKVLELKAKGHIDPKYDLEFSEN